jgi:hypothetical protein
LKGEYAGTTYLGDDPTNKVTAVASGRYHSVALAADGTVYTWGWNLHGRLGDNTEVDRHTPIKVHGIDNVGDLALPIELASFTAKGGIGRITLNWTTQSEVDNLGFIIEGSFEVKSYYIEIASYQTNPDLQGQGNTTHPTEYSYTDKNLTNGITYYYRLIDVDYNGNKTYHDPISATPYAKEQIASRFYLYPNYPNPFNPITNIKFEIPETTNGSEEIELTIYDNLGKEVKNLFRGQLGQGIYELQWDGTSNSGNVLPSGCYYIRFKSKDYSKTRKILLLR